jgi:hypothetical protein
LQVWVDGVPPSIASATRTLTLVPGSVARTSGSDALGSFDAVSSAWVSGDGGVSDSGGGDVRGIVDNASRLGSKHHGSEPHTPVHVVTEWAVYVQPPPHMHVYSVM